MMNEFFISKRQEYLENLYERYKAVFDQKSRTTSSSDRISLDEDIKQLEVEIKKIQAEIDDFRVHQKSANFVYRQTSRTWEEDLHKINFSRVESILNRIFNNLKGQGGSALFLLKRSHSMGGRWCVQKIKYRIEAELGTLVAPCQIGFSHVQTANPFEFLNLLGERFAVDVKTASMDVQSCIQNIIEKIINSLTSGNIFLIEVDIHVLNTQNTFLKWFVEDFWILLTSRLSAISSQKRKIRLIAIITVKGKISGTCLPRHLCCKKSNFDGSKILELPLQKWTETEIRDWLFDFSGLTAQSTQLDDRGIEQMARTIHQMTEGVPNEVYDHLMDAMTKYAC